MGLIGKYTHIQDIPSETETKMITVTYPDFPEGHPDFELSGKQEEIEVPVVERIETIYENAYVNIKASSSWKNQQLNKHFTTITYDVFESKEAKENGDEPIETNIVPTVQFIAGEEHEILRGYEELKKTEPFDTFIND